MNGIVPGPPWLAIASAINGASHENGNLIQDSKNDTVTRKLIENQFGPADTGNQRIGDDGFDLRPPARSRGQEGG